MGGKMSVSIRNFEKFFEEHPEHSELKESALAQAKLHADSRGIIPGQSVQRCLGNIAPKFFKAIQTYEHMLLYGIDMQQT